MRLNILFASALFAGLTFASYADNNQPSVASIAYVQQNTVSVSADANQKLAGEYDVTGIIFVETPALPSAE